MTRNLNKTIKYICTGSVLLSIMLVACKKDNKQGSAPNGKLETVTFVVNGFTQHHLGITTNSVNAGSLTTNSTTDTIPTYPVLYYQVFNSSGKFVHQIYQDNTTTNFGTITDQLLPGDYTIIMIGGENQKTGYGTELTIIGNTSTTVSSTQDEMKYYSIEADPPAFFDETFYKKFSFTATSGTSSQNVTLTHLVGQLVVNIKDAIPANVGLIELFVNRLITSADAYTGMPNPKDTVTGVAGYSKTSAYSFTSGETNYQMSNYMMNTIYPFSVSIAAYAKNPSTGNFDIFVASKTIDNVTCSPNQQTILTGNLFGGTGTNSTGNSTTSFKADSSWNSTVLNYHF